MMYYRLYEELTRRDFKVTEGYDDQFMNQAVLLHEGDSMPGFPSADVFNSLIQPQIEKLHQPALDLLQEVYRYLEDLADLIKDQTFARFPTFGTEIMDKITEVMQEERKKATELVEALIESEETYMFTNDPEYLLSRTDIVPVHGVPKI